jgi:diguanylate cyclase (GGDEF)-like protein
MTDELMPSPESFDEAWAAVSAGDALSAESAPLAGVSHPGLMGFLDLVEATVEAIGADAAAAMPLVVGGCEHLEPAQPFDLGALGLFLAREGIATDQADDVLLFLAMRAGSFPVELPVGLAVLGEKERTARVTAFQKRYATALLFSADAPLPTLWADNTPVVSLGSLPTVDPTRRTATLTVMTGAELGRVHRIDKPFVVLGRGEAADIVLDARGMSRAHAEVELRGGDVIVRDIGSRNGVFVNGLGVREHVLNDGDRLQVGEAILKFAWHDELEDTFQMKLLRSLTEDPLTGVANRGYFTERLRAECAYCRRSYNPLALLMIDVDHFKSINDTYGHLAGDHVLTGIGELLKEAVRVEDLVGRYGGEEFAVLLRGAPAEPAHMVADRIRRTIADQVFLWKGDRMLVTVSVGMASFELDKCDSPTELIAVADERLYRAKDAGRNRVVAS